MCRCGLCERIGKSQKGQSYVSSSQRRKQVGGIGLMSFSEELKANETLRMEPFLLSKLIFILNNNIIIQI